MPEELTLLRAVILLSQEETSVSRVQLRQQVLLNGGTSQKNFVSGSNMQIFFALSSCILLHFGILKA